MARAPCPAPRRPCSRTSAGSASTGTRVPTWAVPQAPTCSPSGCDRYRAAAERLTRDAHTFPCTCSRKEIAFVASAPHGEDGPIYPGTCLAGPSHPDREPALRFRMPEEPPSFGDGLHGRSSGLGRGDFVLVRKDGVFAYQLACAVDDLEMGITEVVRGDDLLGSTPRQIAILRALGAEPPAYAHVPLVLGPDGERLAKRHGAITLAALREGGWSPERVVGHLAESAGLTEDDSPIEASALVSGFDFARLSRAPAVHRA